MTSDTKTGEETPHSLEAYIAYAETKTRNLIRVLSSIRVTVPVMTTPLGFSIPVSPYVFAIALDTSTATARSTNATVTVSHTCTGSSLLFLNGAIIDDNNTDSITASSYNSVNLTIGSGNLHAASDVTAQQGQVYINFLINPSTGANTYSQTHSVPVTFAQVGLNASYSGVSQSGFPDASSKITTQTSVNLTTTVTIVAANSWGFIANTNNGGDQTAGTNTTLRQQTGGGTANFMGDSNGAQPAGSFSMTVNRASSVWSGCMVSFAPDTGAATTTVVNFLSLLGVGL